MLRTSTLQAIAEQRRHRLQRMAYLSLTILVGLCLMGYQLWEGYQVGRHGAQVETGNYAAIIEARLDATLRRIDADLLDILRNFPVAALKQQAVPKYAHELNGKLAAHRVNFKELEALRIFDAEGDQLYAAANPSASRPNVADRSYFRLLRDKPQLGLVFSEVIQGRFSQGQSIVIAARALTDARGIFRGAVAAAISLGEFERLFKSLDIGPQGLIAIRRSDNFQGVVRWPLLAGDANRVLPPGIPTRQVVERGQKSGTFEFAASTDRVVRIFSFRVLEQYPFYVTAAVAHDDVLANWRRTALAVGLAALILLGLLANFLYQLWRSEAREARMLAALDMSGERIRLLASVFEHSNEAILITDRNNCIVETNPAFTRLTGYTLDEVRGRNPRVLSSGRTSKQEYQAMWRSIQETGFWRGELWDKNKDGTVYPKWLTISVIRDEADAIVYHIANFIDISERKNVEEKMRYLAHHDVLTGLSNRYNLEGRLEQALAMARRDKGLIALLFIDMDSFKSINDNYGHHVGDGLLQEVAKRLLSSVREGDVVARLGGDEFVVVLNQVDGAMVRQLAENLRAALARPYDIEGRQLRSSPSIGVAIFPDHGADAPTLMKNADAAMYSAKLAGRNTVKIFSGEMKAAAERAPTFEGLQ